MKYGLKNRKIDKYDDIIRFAEVDGIITKHELKLLNKIRKNYNDIKHKLYYPIDKKVIFNLIEEFSKNMKI